MPNPAALNDDSLHRVLSQAVGGSLKKPPAGGEVRQPDAKTKPWEALGTSRATWYRLGKPEKERELENSRYHRQAREALS